MSCYPMPLLASKNFREQNKSGYIAWLCVIANADGFKWTKLSGNWFTKIYHKELNLPLDEIMRKTLAQALLQGPSSTSTSILSTAILA